MTIVERALDILDSAMYTFRPVNPWDVPRFAWRMSQDVWDNLAEWAKGKYGWDRSPWPPHGASLLGWPIAIDPALPPNSMLLEPK